MYYFVKTELSGDKVDEFTEKLANDEIQGVRGNMSYVTPDGRMGFDIVECSDENDCRQKYSDLTQHGLKIDEMMPVEPMSEFIKDFKSREEGTMS